MGADDDAGLQPRRLWWLVEGVLQLLAGHVAGVAAEAGRAQSRTGRVFPGPALAPKAGLVTISDAFVWQGLRQGLAVERLV